MYSFFNNAKRLLRKIADSKNPLFLFYYSKKMILKYYRYKKNYPLFLKSQDLYWHKYKSKLLNLKMKKNFSDYLFRLNDIKLLCLDGTKYRLPYNLIEKFKVEANKLNKNKFTIFNNIIETKLNHNSGKYNWFRDYQTDFTFEMLHYTKIRNSIKNKETDIKNIWELARLQFLTPASVLYNITSDEVYAKKVIDVIEDFRVSNPFEIGPNWVVSMEVGIRLSNILFNIELIKSSPHLSENIMRDLFVYCNQHVEFINNNPENIGGISSNHYLGGLLGLIHYHAFFDFLPGQYTKLNKLKKQLESEIDKQVLPDGFHYEGSSSYHRLVGELFLISIIILERKDVNVSYKHKEKVLEMAKNSLMLINDGSHYNMIQLGDNDSGRVYKLLNDNDNSHTFFINLAYSYFKNKRYDFVNDTSMLISPSGEMCNLPKNEITHLKFTNIVKFRNENLSLITSALSPHKYKMGGHVHNDILSFELVVKGLKFIVDPGTATYTGNYYIRNQLRSTINHSTICVNNTEQRVFIDKELFYTQNNVKNVMLSISSDLNTEMQINGKYTHASKTLKYTHKREFLFLNGHEIKIKDEIFDCEITNLLSTIQLHPEVQIIEDFSDLSTWKLCRGDVCILLSSSHKYTLSDSLYSPEYNSYCSSKKLISNFTDSKHNISILVL